MGGLAPAGIGTGGAVVGATVVAKSLSGISNEAVTDATGTYRFAPATDETE